MSAIGSGSPRWNTSRCSCGRPMSWPDSLAERLQALEPPGQRIGHVLGARPVGARRLRQQQPRFQVGEPRRHHEIVGGKLEAQLPRLLDEGEILLGQRQDRDLGEIDLLLAGERQQQVERALEALDVDQQRRLVGAALGEFGLEGSRLRSSGESRSSSCAANSRRAAGKIDPGRRLPHSQSRRRRAARHRRQAPAPRPPPPASRRACRCNGAPDRSPPRATPASARRSIPTARPSKRRRSSTARRIR